MWYAERVPKGSEGAKEATAYVLLIDIDRCMRGFGK